MTILPDVKTIGDVKKTLNDFIEPPTKEYVSAELKYLYNMNLITSDKADGVLTIYGTLASELNVEPADALCLAMSYRLNCFREVLAIICVTDAIDGTIDNLFTLPKDILDESNQTSETNSDKAQLTSNQLKHLTNKFNTGKNHFDNRYGDHIGMLKIFGEYEKKRKNKDSLKDWAYKYFIDKYVLEKAYQQYVKLKHRYRPLLTEFNSSTTSKLAIDNETKYKVLASLMFGYNLNLLKVDSKGKIKTYDSKINNIELEKNCFVDRELKSTDKLFYNNLYKFDANPVKAKIVSLVSKKGLDIIEQVSQL